MFIRICIFALWGLCSTVAAEQNLLDEAREAFAYVYSDAVQKLPYNELDLTALEHSAGLLDKVIEKYNFPSDDEIAYHQALIHAILILNFARIELDQKVHIDQLEAGLNKVNLLLENNPNITDFGDLLFHSGHIARFLLEDPISGYHYWHQCAEQSHAGCMNILAFNYFTGGRGIRQDIEKSYDWHIRTYMTEINYHCAGVYSARMARQMLFFFPELSESKQWRDWTPEILELIEQLEAKYPGESNNMCGKAQVLMDAYLYEFHEGKTENLELLSQAKEIIDGLETAEDDNTPIDAFKLIGTSDFFDKSLTLLQEIRDPVAKCTIGFRHIIYSQALQNRKHAEAIFSLISGLDLEMCDDKITTYELLQTKGIW